MENKPVRPLTAAEQQLLQNVLLELLAAQIVRFTAGERSSVPAEKAQALMASLCMTLEIQNPARARQLLHGDAGAALAAGQKHLQYRWALCRQLWQRAADTAPVWQNLALRETLESIGQSITAKAAYHVQFFAHELPCSIDYPLCDPVPETLQGAEYLAEYLKRLCEENALLAAVNQAAARRMALASCPDYAKLLVNLCEPTAVQLLGKSLLGHPLYPLELDAAQRHAVGRIACALPTGQLREELYSNAYLFVLPSDLEGMSLCLLEAMSYGNCVLCTDIEESTNVVGEHGLRFQKNDRQSLAEKMQYALEHRNVVKIFKYMAPEYVCSRFPWDKVVAKTLELYGVPEMEPAVNADSPETYTSV